MSDKSVISSIRLPVEVKKKVSELAEKQRRSFSNLCAYYIEQGYEREMKLEKGGK